MKETLKSYKTIEPVVLVLLLLYFFTQNWYFFWIAVALLCLNTFFIKISMFLALYWMKLALFLGTVNSKIILTLIYFLILTPLAYFFRIFNPSIKKHFKSRRKSSYFYDVKEDITPDFFIRQW